MDDRETRLACLRLAVDVAARQGNAGDEKKIVEIATGFDNYVRADGSSAGASRRKPRKDPPKKPDKPDEDDVL